VELKSDDMDRECLTDSSPFKLVEPYLDKSGGLEEFTDFKALEYCGVCSQGHTVDEWNGSEDDGFLGGHIQHRAEQGYIRGAGESSDASSVSS
jgi:hypothetical protein